MITWKNAFLNQISDDSENALIILNQPFSLSILLRLWNNTAWHCCADGGANHLYDALSSDAAMLHKCVSECNRMMTSDWREDTCLI